MRRFTLSAAVVALATLSGCAQMSSGEVATHDIQANIKVTADGSGDTFVSAELTHDRADWHTYVNLNGGDALHVSAAGRTRTMGESDVFNIVGYGARMPVDRGGTEFQISFDRPAFESAPDSFVRLPRDFVLLPPARSVYDVDRDPVLLEWAGLSRDEMLLSFEGSCISDERYGMTVDTGFFLLEPGMVAPHPSWDGRPCEIRVTAERVRGGQLDAAFAHGSIEASQLRTTYFWIEGF